MAIESNSVGPNSVSIYYVFFGGLFGRFCINYVFLRSFLGQFFVSFCVFWAVLLGPFFVSIACSSGLFQDCVFLAVFFPPFLY